MHNVALTWQQAGWLAFVLLAVGASGRWALAATFGERVPSGSQRLANIVVPMIIEIGIIAALYSVWQYAGTAPVFDAAGAMRRGEWIESAEKAVHLPSEHVAQQPLLAHPLLAQTANLYYATLHFTAMFALLLWVYLRHRDSYRQVRTLLVLLTLFCFIIELLPVAPPRLLPGAGYVDTAEQYGQSVYSAFGAIGPDQLSAMPSLHVGWALMVALVAVTVSTSPWRWVVVAHAVLTVYIVSATANHYWADGIVAALLLALALGGQRAARGVRSKRTVLERPQPEPVPV